MTGYGPGFLTPKGDNRPALIAPVNFGQEGIAFARNLMLEQQRPLSSAVVHSFNNEGLAFAPLEKGIALEEARQFAMGRFMPTLAIRTWLVDYAVSRWGSAFAWIVEDPWMYAEEQRKYMKKPWFSCANTPYYAPQESDKLAELLVGEQLARSYVSFIFIVNPPVALPTNGTAVDQDYIELLAQRTQAVLISAYDFEGYVVWSRHI